MRTINTDDYNIEKIIEEAKRLVREYAAGYVGTKHKDSEEIIKRLVKKIWGFDDGNDDPKDVPKLGDIYGKNS